MWTTYSLWSTRRWFCLGHCQVEMPQDVVNALTELTTLVNIEDNSDLNPNQVAVMQGVMGRPKYVVSPQQLQSLIEMYLPATCIAKLLGISERTVRRRMHDNGLYIMQSYSNLTDKQLDNLVRSVKARTPHVGYRMMKGILLAMGHRVQWKRASSSMHPVDSVGGPLHLVHIDTNHKLIRYGFIIFGGIDGFSRKVISFLLINISEMMKVENDLVLDPSDSIHLFCAQHVFLPRLQRDLDVFRMGWDNHPLRTERNLSPQQLWTIGLLQNPIDDLAEVVSIFYFLATLKYIILC
uniref:Integrase core domain-containing protein n=1 Tax=Cyclopterus lumpus TaxID=8103 RepID=A0A8C2WY87_CYCLU